MKKTILALILTAGIANAKTFTIKVNYPDDPEKFAFVAQYFGWQALVPKVINGEELTVNNPVSAEQYLLEQAEEELVNWIHKPLYIYEKEQAMREVDATIKDSKQFLKNSMEGSIN